MAYVFGLLFLLFGFNANASEEAGVATCGFYYEGDARIAACVSAETTRWTGGGGYILVDTINRYQGLPREHQVQLVFCPKTFPSYVAGRCDGAPPDPCEMLAEMCTGSKGMSKGFSMDGKKAGISFTCMSPFSVGGNSLPGCTKGCMAQVGGFATAMQSDAGNWVTSGTATYVGSTCDPSTINDLNAEADPDYEPEENPKTTDGSNNSCPNGFPGQVNGVTVCVPPKASSGVTEMEEKDNGDGTKTKSKTEVKCENGKCEITKSSTTTNTTNNTTVSSSSTTTTVDKAAYCAQNKTAGACKDEKGNNEDGDGSFGGSCDAGFTCKGDAVMCAMAKEQHKRACDTLEPVKDENSLWKKIEAGTDGESAKAMQARATEINITTQLDKTGYGWPRTCPANARIDLNFVPGYFEIPFFQICPPLQIFSFIALAITALSLLVWLIFAGREKAGS